MSQILERPPFRLIRITWMNDQLLISHSEMSSLFTTLIKIRIPDVEVSISSRKIIYMIIMMFHLYSMQCTPTVLSSLDELFIVQHWTNEDHKFVCSCARTNSVKAPTLWTQHKAEWGWQMVKCSNHFSFSYKNKFLVNFLNNSHLLIPRAFYYYKKFASPNLLPITYFSLVDIPFLVCLFWQTRFWRFLSHDTGRWEHCT